jgi:hypothetical protein
MRQFDIRQRWQSGADILKAAASSYHEDMWAGQKWRVFVVVEKDALSGILAPVCRKWDVPLLAARGYPSASVLHEFALDDIVPALVESEQSVIILHLGDHDPSGIDMTRDLEDRLALFSNYHASREVELERLALNMEQVEELKPPPNFAKQTDKRYAAYVEVYGSECWELDALPPEYLVDLVEGNIKPFIDQGAWDETATAIESVKTKLLSIAQEFKGA